MGVIRRFDFYIRGAVVTTADTLMTIVPEGTGIEVD
jgi:hypothetical protein